MANCHCSTAQKIRRSVVKETDRIQKSALDGKEVRKLKDLEAVMATYVFLEATVI